MRLTWPAAVGLGLILAGAGWWTAGTPGAAPPGASNPAGAAATLGADSLASAAPTSSAQASGGAQSAQAAPSKVACLGPAPTVAKAPAPPYPLSGRLGLWVAEVDPRTLQVLRAVGTNPDSVFPLASTYKQAVLWAALREFDAGRLSPEDRLSITDADRSLGDYPFDRSNVRTLTERMIRNSDNTATDLLHRRVGLQRVQAVADELGLCQTRVMMPTKAWWVMESGLSPTYLSHPNWWDTGDRLKLAAQIDAEARRQRVEELAPVLDQYFEQVHEPRDDLGAHNVSTPYEFAALLTHQYLGSGLSPRAQRWQAEVARLGYGRAGLRAAQVGNVETFYGKGGNGWRLLTYTGYFKTKDGHHVVYAFMQHGADQWYTMPNTFRAFAWINAAVDEVIGKQRRRPPPVSGSGGASVQTASKAAKAEVQPGANGVSLASAAAAEPVVLGPKP